MARRGTDDLELDLELLLESFRLVPPCIPDGNVQLSSQRICFIALVHDSGDIIQKYNYVNIDML